MAFSTALGQIKITQEIVDWTRQALLESSEAERQEREANITRLTSRYKKLDSYISAAYEDKLEGRIELALWEQKTFTWKNEQEQIQGQLQAYLFSPYSVFARWD